MRVIDARNSSLEKVAAVLKKPSFDEVELSEGAKERIAKTFGRVMTAGEVVGQIVADVREQGNAALLKYTELIDGAALSADSLFVKEEEFVAAAAQVESNLLVSLQKADDNIRRYHAEQRPSSWFTYREHGAMLGQSCIPLGRVGIYVPGGTAAYPSSVLMNAIPAAVAGVKEIVMAVPPDREGTVNPLVLVAAKLAGVTQVLKAGGAQAIAALAFGTETLERVDKITGPGNLFVTLAKKAVYGHCDIDMLAGPSEILIVADDSADAAYIAADMLSQAEHDPLSSSILITVSDRVAAKVNSEIKRQLAKLPRREIAAEALARNGLILLAPDLAAAMELANMSAPEHLELLTEQPLALLPLVRNAGAVFLGPYSPEPLGDYLAGPNHVLPTGGTARFYSVLNVETFMKRTSVIAYTQAALAAVSDDVVRLAEAEGLAAHAQAIRIRREPDAKVSGWVGIH